MATSSQAQAAKGTRGRVPAAERREALIDAAVHAFAESGYHGTPVDRVARRVGVAQPYVFSLFHSKRELFLAAVQRGFDRVGELMAAAAQAYDPTTAPADVDVLKAMGTAYVEVLKSDRDLLMLQLHAFAACDDPVVRAHVRRAFAHLARHVESLAGDDIDPERFDEFFRYGMGCNVAAAMGIDELSIQGSWIDESLAPAAG